MFQHQQITPAPTPAQVAQRSYTVEQDPQPDWSARRGLDWTVRRYGQGNDWTHCHGTVSMHATKEAAREFGDYWLSAGRVL